MTIHFADDEHHIAKIKVIGVGGSGGNIINHMYQRRSTGVDYVAVNTDAQALSLISGDIECVHIGRNKTRGLGAGGDPKVAEEAAWTDAERLRGLVRGMDMVFVTAGLGGGTGTGVAPVIAELAKEEGALCVAVVTYPFTFERRQRKADAGAKSLFQHVDSFIQVQNDKVREVVENASAKDAFVAPNEVLHNAICGIADIINRRGFVNVDFNDVRTAMTGKGKAVIGSYECSGEDRARDAAMNALRCPLMEDIDLSNAGSVLVNITGHEDRLKLDELYEVESVINENVPDFNGELFMGMVFDDGAQDDIRVTVIVTGVNNGQYAELKAVSTPSHRAAENGAAVKDPIFKSGRTRSQINRILDENNGDEKQIPTVLRRQMS